MEAEASIFVLTMRAVAGPRNSEPDGRRYTILAFTRGADEDAATAAAFAGLDILGWDEAEALRCGEVTDEGAVPPDMQGTLARARRDGCALIIYDEP